MRFKKTIFLLLFILLITSCSHSKQTVLQGYIEGHYTYLASAMSGQLDELTVSRGDQVKTNQLIFVLDQQPETDVKKINELNANLSEAKLGARKNQIKAQQETVAAAKADVKQATWALAQKTMFAPISGTVFDTYYRVGEFVPANQPIVSLIAPQNIKLIFFVPEPLLSTIILGQTIQFTCDSCKEKTPATISFISQDAEYTPPVIYSKDSRDKLVYRVEAKIAPDIAIRFHTGQPVDVYLKNN